MLERSLPCQTEWLLTASFQVRAPKGRLHQSERPMPKSIFRLSTMLSLCMASHAWAAPPGQGGANQEQGAAISLDALASDVIVSNPERKYYADQIRLGSVAAVAAGRPQDPARAVGFGGRGPRGPATGLRPG